MMRTSNFVPHALTAAMVAVFLLALPGFADDRDLLREATRDPYVFLVLDTSGSMNWTPPCTLEDYNNGDCDYLCPDGDCLPPLRADDPASKMYQAKEALTEVIDQVNNVYFGYSTYNQNQLRVERKHWWYEVQEEASQPDGLIELDSGHKFPGLQISPAALQLPSGSRYRDVFGETWSCDPDRRLRGQLEDVGCYGGMPASMTDPWSVKRVQNLSKLDDDNDTAVEFFIQDTDSKVYLVRYSPIFGEQVGSAQLDVQVAIWRCDRDRCDPGRSSDVTFIASKRIEFDRVSDFIYWDLRPDNSPPEEGFFAGATQTSVYDTCNGLELNTDSGDDDYGGLYNLKYPTTSDTRGAPFALGDLIPFDWDNRQRERIQARLTPTLAVSAAAPRDFSIAPYFEDSRFGGETFHRLKNGFPLGEPDYEDNDARPLVPTGSTPIGASMTDFQSWYRSWRAIAATQDRDFGCRRKFLIIVTDGDETCGGDPCLRAEELREQDGVLTFVVGFGLASGNGNTLNCIASNGGTGQPFFPKNKDELVEALTSIFDRIQEKSRAFASAAVPTVQVDVQDSIYLTSFIPFNDTGYWSGHLDGFVKPLPLTASNEPDRDATCSGPSDEGCLAWDAGAKLLEQAPSAIDFSGAASTYAGQAQIGRGADDRRIFYSQDNAGGGVPDARKDFLPPDPTAIPNGPLDFLDLSTAMRPNNPLTLDQIKETLVKTLVEKTETIDNPAPGDPPSETYILGDIFHSEPVVIGRPENFRYFAGNHKDYRDFFAKHQYRRRMVAVGSNDGMVHFFDAGLFEVPAGGDLEDGRFGTGTGKEVLAYVPRPMLEVLRERFENQDTHFWGVDGTLRFDDAYIDPVHGGPFSLIDPPDEDDREWRTVIVGGLREGGNGYFALDITQPDTLDTDGVPVPVSGTEYVPSCIGTVGGSGTYDATACGPLPFGAPLWEFTDTRDEDANGEPDLGQTWSVPNLGRIRVCTGAICDPNAANNDVEDRYVVVFGGGLDPAGDSADGDTDGLGQLKGSWLYMVDLETGHILYKRLLVGSAPSEPAAVDTNQDGILDTIYIGTTAGYMYKASISKIAELEQFDTPIGPDPDGAGPLTAPMETVLRVRDADWDPFIIFNAQTVSNSGLRDVKGIYHPPSVIFVPSLGKYALAFGTGNRENLWSEDNFQGQFFVILDNDFRRTGTPPAFTPKTPADYREIDPNTELECLRANLLTQAPYGWYYTLSPNERVITSAFALAGVTFFSSFVPDEEPVLPPGDDDDTPSGICRRTGVSNVYGFLTLNGTAVGCLEKEDTDNDGIPDPPTSKSPKTQVPDFVTNPYTNPPKGRTVCDSASKQAIAKAMEALFPSDCQFGNFQINLETIQSETGVVCIAPIPICVIERNWKEF